MFCKRTNGNISILLIKFQWRWLFLNKLFSDILLKNLKLKVLIYTQVEVKLVIDFHYSVEQKGTKDWDLGKVI